MYIFQARRLDDTSLVSKVVLGSSVLVELVRKVRAVVIQASNDLSASAIAESPVSDSHRRNTGIVIRKVWIRHGQGIVRVAAKVALSVATVCDPGRRVFPQSQVQLKEGIKVVFGANVYQDGNVSNQRIGKVLGVRVREDDFGAVALSVNRVLAGYRHVGVSKEPRIGKAPTVVDAGPHSGVWLIGAKDMTENVAVEGDEKTCEWNDCGSEYRVLSPRTT